MIYISHRGNINKKNDKRENSENYILEAVAAGYDVEVDVWLRKGSLFLGHDNPSYPTKIEFLKSKNIWCHAKDIECFQFLLINKCKTFFHNIDDCTLTSNKKIWTYPGKKLTKNSIAVLPELYNYTKEELDGCFGICSDNIQFYKEN